MVTAQEAFPCPGMVGDREKQWDQGCLESSKRRGGTIGLPWTSRTAR